MQRLTKRLLILILLFAGIFIVRSYTAPAVLASKISCNQFCGRIASGCHYNLGLSCEAQCGTADTTSPCYTDCWDGGIFECKTEEDQCFETCPPGTYIPGP